MAERTQEECLAIFEKAGVTVGAVADVAQLAEHPYALDREVIVSLPDADTGRLAMHNVIPRLSATPDGCAVRRRNWASTTPRSGADWAMTRPP